MKFRFSLGIFGAISLMASLWATGQNLNFEDATVPPTPVGGWGLNVSAEDAFPGWTIGYSPENALSLDFVVLYNNLTLGTPAVDLIGPEFPNWLGLMPLEGNYSAVLQSFVYGGHPLYGGIMSLSCGVAVPSDARSVTLLVGGNPSAARLALSGVNIPLVSIGGGRMAGDVTAFAGTGQELKISTDSTVLYFDDIQFSPQSVPEPMLQGFVGTAAALAFFLRRWSLSVERLGSCSNPIGLSLPLHDFGPSTISRKELACAG